MRKPKTEREHPLAIYVTFDQPQSYDWDRHRFISTFYLVTVHPRQEERGYTIRNLDTYGADRGLRGLKIEVAASLDYGFSYRRPCITCYDPELAELESVVKALRPVQKRLYDLADKEGEPSTPGDYLVRVCRALKIDGYQATVFCREKAPRGSYDDNTYDFRSPGNAKHQVNAEFANWLKEQKEAGREIPERLALSA